MPLRELGLDLKVFSEIVGKENSGAHDDNCDRCKFILTTDSNKNNRLGCKGEGGPGG